MVFRPEAPLRRGCSAPPAVEWRAPFLLSVGGGHYFVPVRVRAGLPDPTPGLIPSHQLTRMRHAGRLSVPPVFPVAQIRDQIVRINLLRLSTEPHGDSIGLWLEMASSSPANRCCRTDCARQIRNIKLRLRSDYIRGCLRP